MSVYLLFGNILGKIPLNANLRKNFYKKYNERSKLFKCFRIVTI